MILSCKAIRLLSFETLLSETPDQILPAGAPAEQRGLSA
jgi:hypothetical protein